MDINLETIMEFLVPLLTIILGALTAYLKANEKLKNSSVKYIIEAEELYKDVSKAGGMKFSFVVDTLYNLVPYPLRIIITRACIEKIVQSTFNGIEAYAKTQIDKAVDKYFENMESGDSLNSKKTDTDRNNNTGNGSIG